MRQIKAVIFDLDGTLANTLPFCIHAFRQSIEPLINRSVSDEEIIATFGPSEEGTIKALAPDYYDKGVANYLHQYELSHHMCPSTFAGIPELISFLKKQGVHISLVTGKGRYSTEISLKHFELEDAFEFVETGSALGPRKPECIAKILAKLGNISKEEVIYVGDAPSDILASREAGVSAIAAAWAETAEPEKLLELKPDELFYSFENFSIWLKQNV